MRVKFPYHASTSLSSRLSAATEITVVCCFLFGALVASILLYVMISAKMSDLNTAAADLFTDTAARELSAGNAKNIPHAADTLIRHNNITKVRVLDAAGKVLSEYDISDRTDSHASEQRFRKSITGADGTLLGTVEVAFPRSGIFMTFFHSFLIMSIPVLAAALLIIFILRRKIRLLISLPLARFLDSAKSLSAGEPYRKIDIPYDNEVGLLAKEFNRIMDDLRREQEHKIASQKFETIGALAGGIAHDFNNILGGIIGNVSLLRYKIGNGSAGKDEIDGYLHTVETISQKAVALSKQLLSLSKPRESEHRPVNLETVIGNVAEICRKTIDKSIDITARPMPKNATTTGDASQIEQALLNVCINAAHSMTIMRPGGAAPGGKLVISLYGPVFPAGDTSQFSCSTEIPYWAISVSDEGVGMESTDISRVYDPFFTTKGGQGSGLGMTMVYSIINRHAGFIAIESKKGKGTSVTLHLPEFRVEPEQSAKPVKKGFIPKTNGMVLLVDDEDYILQMATSILSFGGYQSVKASNGTEAVNIFIERQNEISLVVLDLVMPGKSGLETYHEILSINPSARVLFTSGLGSSVGNIVAKIPKNAAFLPKPYTAEQLLRIVDKLVTADDHSVF